MNQDEIESLGIFAEQHYCQDCKITPCEIFTSGIYEKCTPLLAEFEKRIAEYHTFLASAQVPFIPGKCVFCRNEEMNDKDTDYTLTTLRNLDGTIRLRGYLCSYHRAKEWV